MECYIENCGQPVLVKKYKLCENHYRRMLRNGSPTIHINQPHGCARTRRVDGYIYITVEGKQVMEHRHFIEQSLKRQLLPTEIVHHKDGDRANNALSNLELLDKRAHDKLHGHERTSLDMAYMRSFKGPKHTVKKED